MRTDISMRKDRNLSSSSVYIRTWGAQGRAGAHPRHVPILGGGSGSQDGGRYLLLFPGKRPVCFGYQHLQRGDVVVAQVNLRQGSESGAGGAPGRRRRCPRAPYLVALVPGHRERHLVLLAGHDVFPAGGGNRSP